MRAGQGGESSRACRRQKCWSQPRDTSKRKEEEGEDDDEEGDTVLKTRYTHSSSK